MASSSQSQNSSKQAHLQQHDNVVVAQGKSTTADTASDTSNHRDLDSFKTLHLTPSPVVSRRTVQNLAKFVDPNVQLDEETEDLLMGYSDEFLEEIIEGACKMAAHRKSTSLDVADIEMYLERHCNMWICNDPSKEDLFKSPPKKISPSEAHRQRMALIKKTLKKY